LQPFTTVALPFLTSRAVTATDKRVDGTAVSGLELARIAPDFDNLASKFVPKHTWVRIGWMPP
jgi:hypothetical protein